MTCDTAGRVTAWLAIGREQLHQVHAHPQNTALLVHTRVGEFADFDSDPSQWPSRLVDDSGYQPPGRIQVPGQLAARLEMSDRVTATRVQRFTSEVHAIAYETLLSAGSADVAGVPPQVASSSDWKPLVVRAGMLGGATLILFGVLVKTYASYNAQSAWHDRFGHGSLVLWLAFAAMVAIVATLAGLSLPRRTWSMQTAWAPAGVGGALLIATAVAFGAGGPTVVEANEAMVQGDSSRAQLIAESLVYLDEDSESAHKVLDQLHYRAVLGADGLDQKADIIGDSWYNEGFAEKARAHLLETAHKDADQHKKRCNASGLDYVSRQVGVFDPRYGANLSAHALLCRVPECTDCSCVTRRLNAAAAAPAKVREEVRAVAHRAYRTAFNKDFGAASTAIEAKQRVARLKQALTSSECVAKLGSPVEEATLSKAKSSLAAAEKTVQRQKERAAREAERRRKVEEARKRRQEAIEKAQAKARARASAPLLCCDGSYSPSCTCGRRRRGCCSHHGGVCGCSAD